MERSADDDQVFRVIGGRIRCRGALGHCDENSVIDRTGRVGPFRIERSAGEGGLGGFLLIVGQGSRRRISLHTL